MSTFDVNPNELDPNEAARQERIKCMPPIGACYNLLDFESVARNIMKKSAWAYYSSGSDDEITMRENRSAFQRIWFNPRVLVDVESIDITTTMLGVSSEAPFYVSAAALGKLGHPEGELLLTRGSGKHGIIQMIPTLASCSFDEICDAKTSDEQIQWLQLYVNKDRAISERIVRHAEQRGCRALFITVDAPQLGRREKDMRTKFEGPGTNIGTEDMDDRSEGAARAISSFIDPSLSWKDLPWFRSITKMPIVLKGIQTIEDVLLAIDAGVDGIVLSNHGGRQLDFAPSGIELLVKVMEVLRKFNLQDRLEVYVDGGVRRGSDVVKAMCLGAAGVGISRPFLYAMSAYGQAGVNKAMALLKDEIVMNMRLLGARTISELTPAMVDVSNVGVHATAVPSDTLSLETYDPLSTPMQWAKSKI